MENSNLRFYDEDTEKFYTEKEVRKMDFEENIGDLNNNKEDIFDNIINVADICKHIEKSLNGSIEEVVNDLNCWWGYNISILENKK